jgi:hypothetical protein
MAMTSKHDGARQMKGTGMSNKITLTIEIEEDMIRAVALQEVRRAFRPEESHFSGGEGTKAIRAQVEAHARRQDWSGMIEEIAADELTSLLRPTVRAALEATIKREMRAIKESGALAELVQASLLEGEK